MPEKRPVQGYDVEIDIMGPSGPAFVGQFQELSVDVKEETEEYWLTGYRNPLILDGDIKISGKLKRGFIDMNIITQLYSTKSLRKSTYIPQSARFTITATFDAPEKGLVGRLRVEMVKIQGFSLAIKAGKGVVDNDFSFEAEGISEA